jgi:hypothetical protein
MQMPNIAQIETKGLYSVRKADYRTVLLNPDPKKPFDQIESGRDRGLNADV